MKKFKNIAIVIVFLSLLVTHTSCHKIDVSPFAAGDCFMTQINGKEIVIRLDNIQSDRITASYFYTNTLFADPHPCSVRLKRKGGILKTAELRRPVRINYNVENDRLIVMCKSPKLPHEIVLEECSPVDTTLFNRQLCTPLYEVKVTPDVEYARADGYWTSYPDEDKRFAEIYTQRLPDLVFTWGSSAGAITALNVAFLRDNNRPESVTKEGRIRKLITVAGASQHSLHVDEHRRIVPYFYTIQDTVARFFYTEIVPQPVNLQHESPQSPYFRINNTNVSEVHWKVEGGLLMETTDSRARVVFFKGAKHHTIRVCGKYKNGVEFCETMNV